MKKHFKSLSLLSFLLALLCACSAAENDFSSASQYSASADPSSPGSFSSSRSDENTDAVIEIAGLSASVAANDGIYQVERCFPSSFSLLYIDPDTQSRIYLCSDPNCSHNTEACQSYIETGSDVPPILINVGQKLLLSVSGTESSNPYLLSMNEDGSGKKKIAEFESNQTLGSLFCTDGTHLYFTIMTVFDNGTFETSLVSFDLESGALEELARLNQEEQTYTFLSCAGSKLIFSGSMDQGRGYFFFDPSTKRFTSTGCTYSPTADAAMVSGSVAYIYSTSEQKLTAFDFRTQEKSELAFSLDDGYQLLGSAAAYDGKIILSEENTNSNRQYYLVSPQTGSGTKISLLNHDTNRLIPIAASSGDWLLVVPDYQSGTEPYTGADGTTGYTDLTQAVYALIRKEDFESSTQNYYYIE